MVNVWLLARTRARLILWPCSKPRKHPHPHAHPHPHPHLRRRPPTIRCWLPPRPRGHALRLWAGLQAHRRRSQRTTRLRAGPVLRSAQLRDTARGAVLQRANLETARAWRLMMGLREVFAHARSHNDAATAEIDLALVLGEHLLRLIHLVFDDYKLPLKLQALFNKRRDKRIFGRGHHRRWRAGAGWRCVAQDLGVAERGHHGLGWPGGLDLQGPGDFDVAHQW